MFDPEKHEAILKLEHKDLASLPSAEDDRHEYKSSATKDADLAEKMSRAASGFWNSGGGLFVAGVNGEGEPDGGIALMVGRQSRRDWIDQVISRVAPRSRYIVQCIEARGSGANIAVGNAVVLIGFAPSEVGPHMASDNRYYIRAGAHTVPATHFLVEAIHARRGFRAPLLRHIVRRKPRVDGVLQLGILCLNDAPALDVEITFDPLPRWLDWWDPNSPLVVPVISSDAPLYFDFHLLVAHERLLPKFNVLIKYHDLEGRQHRAALFVDADRQVGPDFGDGTGRNEMQDIERAIRSVAEVLKRRR